MHESDKVARQSSGQGRGPTESCCAPMKAHADPDFADEDPLHDRRKAGRSLKTNPTARGAERTGAPSHSRCDRTTRGRVSGRHFLPASSAASHADTDSTSRKPGSTLVRGPYPKTSQPSGGSAKELDRRCWIDSQALGRHEISVREDKPRASSVMREHDQAKPSQQLGTESCVAIGQPSWRSVDREIGAVIER
jgi:hypothetical protein